MTRSILLLNLACLALIIATSEGYWLPRETLPQSAYENHYSYCDANGFPYGPCKEDVYEGHLDFMCAAFFCAGLDYDYEFDGHIPNNVGNGLPGTPCGNATQVCDGMGNCVNDPEGYYGKLPRDPKHENPCFLTVSDERALQKFIRDHPK